MLSSLTVNIPENKEEKIYFAIQLDIELFSLFFYSSDNQVPSSQSTKLGYNQTVEVKGQNKTQWHKRIDKIYEEICSLIRLRGFTSTVLVRFGLLMINLDNTVSRIIDLSSPSTFLDKSKEAFKYISSQEDNPLIRKVMSNRENKDNKKDNTEKNDISALFNYIDFNKEKELNNNSLDCINRIILFYNSSFTPVDYKTFPQASSLGKKPNFVLDLFYLHQKISNDEEKDLCTKVFESLNSIKSSNWYSFENSGNLKSFQFHCNLLISSPTIRVKQGKIKGYQEEIESNLSLCVGK